MNIRFGSKKRKCLDLYTLNPGPGTYIIPTTLGKGCPKAVLCSKKRYSFDSCGPGPGAYKPLFRLDTPSYRMGTSVRLKAAISKNPGPHEYSPKFEKRTSPRQSYNDCRFKF